MRIVCKIAVLCLFVFFALVFANAQTPAAGTQSDHPAVPAQEAAPGSRPAGPATRDLPLGPGDEGEMTVYGIPDMSQHFRVGADGEVNLPLLGRFVIGGMTAPQAEAAIEKKYVNAGYLKNPHVNVYIKEFTSQSVSVLGEVAHPGSYSLSFARRLYDAFQVAGGLTAKAGSSVAITHRGEKTATVLPLTNDAATSAANNIDLAPGDTVVVATAGVVYVVGEVIRPGGFVLETGHQPTVSQLIGMAAGPSRLANMSHARLIRRTPTGLENREIDLKKVLAAKAPDFELRPDDILFVPASKGKMALASGTNSILSMVTQMAVYRF